MNLPQGLFRWEQHTEFTSYVFMLSGEAARFDLTGGEAGWERSFQVDMLAGQGRLPNAAQRQRIVQLFD